MNRREFLSAVAAAGATALMPKSAMAYGVTSQAEYLQIIKNAYDFFQGTQCYATGGYGPRERLVGMHGALGQSIETAHNTFECPCGSWAGFKLSRYLLQFTGKRKYGDWIEKLLYNAIGAALPMTGRGRTFYYADYAMDKANKGYFPAAFPCCSGTYFQNVTEYHNLIYFKDGNDLCVNLYLPSEATWQTGSAQVKLTQETNYPDEGTIDWKLELNQPAEFALKFRVPGWARDVAVKVNGVRMNVPMKPRKWAALSRRWQTGDTVEIEIPLLFSKEAIDGAHPHRIACLRGPVVMVEDLAANQFAHIPGDDELQNWFAHTKRRGVYRADFAMRGSFAPFHTFGEGRPYRMYFDEAPGGSA